MVFQIAFRGRKLYGTFEKRAPEVCSIPYQKFARVNRLPFRASCEAVNVISKNVHWACDFQGRYEIFKKELCKHGMSRQEIIGTVLILLHVRLDLCKLGMACQETIRTAPQFRSAVLIFLRV